jgi:hypothetical protein
MSNCGYTLKLYQVSEASTYLPSDLCIALVCTVSSLPSYTWEEANGNSIAGSKSMPHVVHLSTMNGTSTGTN